MVHNIENSIIINVGVSKVNNPLILSDHLMCSFVQCKRGL